MDHGKVLALDTVDGLLEAHGGASLVEAELAEGTGELALPGERTGNRLRIEADRPLEAIAELGRSGVEELVDRHCRQAVAIADGLRGAGVEVLNRVVLNQVLGRLEDDAATDRFREAAVDTGRIWFGPSVYRGRAAFRISVSSWRTTDEDIENAVALLRELAGA